MIVVGAANFGGCLTNHDIGAFFVKNLSSNFTSNRSYMIDYENKFVIHNESVNLLQKTVSTILQKYKNEKILIVIDDYNYKIGQVKFSGYRNTGHNCFKLIPKNQNIFLLRFGIQEENYLNLSEIVLKPMRKDTKNFVTLIAKRFYKAYCIYPDNLHAIIKHIKKPL